MLRSFFDVNTVRVAEYGRVRTWCGGGVMDFIGWMA